MTTSEQLELCKTCQNKKMNIQIGLVCGLTSEKPNFEGSCPDYQTDEKAVTYFKEQKKQLNIHQLEASKSERFLNYLLDSFFRFLIFFGLFALVSRFALIFGRVDIIANMLDWGANFFVLVFIIFSFGYYAFFESASNGKTLAKYITKTKVVDNRGNKPEVGLIISRSFCRMIPFNNLSFLFGTGWHDRLSETMVIKESRQAFED